MTNQRPNRTPKRIGLIAIVLIVLMAITPAFIQIGADIQALSVVNQMFIIGLVMTIFYSSWKVDKSQPITNKTFGTQSVVLVLGIMYGLGIVVVNGIFGSASNILLGDINPTNFYLVMLAGISEELFFRGFLQNFFKTFINSMAVIIPSAMVFAGFHYFAYDANMFSLFIMFMIGLGFGAVYEISGDIGSPMLAHIINNGFSAMPLVILWFQNSIIVVVFLVAVFVVAIMFGRIKKGR